MIQQLIEVIGKRSDPPKAAVPRNVVYPRFTIGGRTDIVNLQKAFHAFLRYLLLEDPEKTERSFLKTVGRFRHVSRVTAEELRLNYPYVMMTSGDASLTTYAAARMRRGSYIPANKRTRLRSEGFCFETDLEGQAGAITAELAVSDLPDAAPKNDFEGPIKSDLVVAVHDDRPEFHENYGLAWWWLTPVDKTLIQGEMKFNPDAYGGAYSARLPDVFSHRLFAAIFYDPGFGLR